MIGHCRRCDAASLIADTDCDVTDVHLNITDAVHVLMLLRLDDVQRLRQGPNVVMGEYERFNFGQFGLLRESG